MPTRAIPAYRVRAASVGSVVTKTIPDFRPAEVGPSGPANSTYATTLDLEQAPVSNVSAILAEVGKAGTFTVRDYTDFTSQVAADTAKLNFIRSSSNTDKVWVRVTILAVSITASEAIAANAFVNVYSSGGSTRVRNAIASDSAKFATGFVAAAIASGDTGTITSIGLNSGVAVGAPASEVWLSDVVPGGIATTPPSSSGSIIQPLGPAIPGVGVLFFPQARVLL